MLNKIRLNVCCPGLPAFSCWPKPLRQTPPDFRQKRLNIGPAESFQWINLMRCDTALMSLVNHRYLATKPNEPGQATANATDPSPARKNGVCFK